MPESLKPVPTRIKKIQRWLWPENCLLCTARVSVGKDICPECERSLPRLQWACPRCAAQDSVVDTLEAVCGECQKNPPAFAYARAPFHYAPPVDRLIRNLKYHGRLELSRILGKYLAAYLQNLNEPPPDVIVPVPLHTSRLRSRGYNQSLEIARTVSKHLALPLNWSDAERIRDTTPQTDLPRDKRRKNVRGAFKSSEAFSGQRIAILDDVMTSGQTVNALAESLLRSDAAEVRVWVVARA